MGGYGSGRPRTRPGAGFSSALDLRLIKSWGWLDGDQLYRGSYEWTHSRWGQVVNRFAIGLLVDPMAGYARLLYGVINGASDTRIDERIGLVRVRGRWLWCCPCGRRAVVLYMPPGETVFRCRRCYTVVYQSSRESDQRVSDTYRNLADIMAGRALHRLDNQRFIWAYKAYQRLQAKQERHITTLIGPPGQRRARYLERVRQTRRRAARKRWHNYRRREARRAARIAAAATRRAGAWSTSGSTPAAALDVFANTSPASNPPGGQRADGGR